ncbi:hypothetical protein bhYOR_001235 (plasmid) [Borrelia nietonii YOR]|nr:hypothetical protein [Borrelia nietonii]UPA09919.1 hypothetical protein bhYOR_001235 [Borrelia nietonii YOR]
MNKSLQFEKQSLAKIEEAIKYIEGENKNWDSSKKAFIDGIKFEEKALMALIYVDSSVRRLLECYPNYTGGLFYSYADLKKLQDKLKMELQIFKGKDLDEFENAKHRAEERIFFSREKQQEDKNKLEQDIQNALKSLKGCMERMNTDIILKSFYKEGSIVPDNYDFDLHKGHNFLLPDNYEFSFERDNKNMMLVDGRYSINRFY